MDHSAKNQIYSVNKNAFSSGQIGSKLWLCEELEALFDKIDTIWVYGGWYGLTGFLLLSRNNIEIGNIRSLDIDQHCEYVADMINENWVIDNWKFKAFTENCNEIEISDVKPDLIINTSTEHFARRSWWDNIPEGTTVALQGNNMAHEDHHIHTESLESFIEQFPLTTILYQGEKTFTYPDWSFTRFMVIGVK